MNNQVLCGSLIALNVNLHSGDDVLIAIPERKIEYSADEHNTC